MVPSSRDGITLCVVSDAPAARLAVLVAPLRPVVAEVFLVADPRVPEAELAGYRQIADRVALVPFTDVGTSLAWAAEHCRTPWLLSMDADEVPSAAFVRALPELADDRRALQWAFPSLWVWPDARHALADRPWTGDWRHRLLRVGAHLRFPGDFHDHALVAPPRAACEAPVLHLDLVLQDEAGRRDKAERYEALRPGMLAAGGRFNIAHYVPEARPHVRTVPLPDEDLAIVAAGLRPPALPPAAPRAELITVDRADVDRLWAGRAVDPATHSAGIELLEPVEEFRAGTLDHVLVRVQNRSADRWHWDLDHGPPIRLGHRWWTPDGALVDEHGPRTPLPSIVDPGESAVVGVAISVPRTTGRLVLEIDMVHELVRWFGDGARVEVDVVESPAWSPLLRERSGAPGTTPIPRILHRVWLGTGPFPEPHAAWWARFAELHPSWTLLTWGDANVDDLGIGDALARARDAREASDLVRYAALVRHGGVYVDVDVEPLRTLDPLLDGPGAVVGLEQPHRAGSALLASAPGHPVLQEVLRLACLCAGVGPLASEATGSGLLTRVLERDAAVRVLPSSAVYGAYVVHHRGSGV